MLKLIIIILFCISNLAHSQQWRVIPDLPQAYVQCIASERNGTIWAGSLGYLYKINGNNLFVYDSTNSPIKSNWIIFDIQIDKNGVKWIGTYRGGLLRFDGTNWTVYNMSNSGMPANLARGIGFEKDTIKWTNSLWPVKFDGYNWRVFTYANSGMPSYQLRSLLVYKGLKFFGTLDSGLIKFNDTTFTVYNSINSGLPFEQVNAIKSEGDFLWIGTEFGGLAKYNYVLNTWKVYTRLNSGLPGNSIESILIQDSNYRWFGTGAWGLARLKYDSVWTVYNPQNSPLPNETVYSLAIDSNKNMWIGTIGGLAEFNENGIVGVNNNSINLVNKFDLKQNYPNPFNGSSKIIYTIRKPSNITLKIFGTLGKEIVTLVNEYKLTGEYSVNINSDDFPSGVYFYTLSSDNYSLTKKFIILK
ncbi:MAG: T9SS type A sorting domain-containing protein [Bacteroidetes bacterium]|nr:T9SS type A sorting domain-containing protein [Bacteroidota bacterium]